MIIEITEKEYRKIPKNSSSSLKDFADDRRKYHKRHILGEKVEDKDTLAALMGQLVETLLMEPDRFDELFYMSACAIIPGGLMGDFVYALAKHTIGATNEAGIVTTPFLDLAEMAHIDSGFKISLAAVIKKFDGTDAEIYYKELVTISINDLMVVTPNDVNNAERIVKELKNNPITSTIVNLESGTQFGIFDQMKVSGFFIDGLEMKSMLDKVIIDYKNSTVQFYDLKCTWNVEKFYKEYYLYRKAYIQAYTYQKAMEHLTAPGNPMAGFKTLLPKFIVCDSINYYSPLIFEITEQDLKDAYNGFSVKGYEYPGVKEIIDGLKWAVKNDKWNISKKNFESNGVVKLTP